MPAAFLTLLEAFPLWNICDLYPIPSCGACPGHASLQREFGMSILPIGAQTCYSLGCYDDYTLPSAKL